MRQLPAFLLLLSALLGCTSTTPNLHTLGPRLGLIRQSASRVVVVRNVDVPRYLERLEIMRSDGPERLVASDSDWWAEPLRVLLARVMVDDLAQRLPNADILAASSTIGPRSDAEVQVSLQHFERDGLGMVSLTGYVAVTANGQTQTLDRLRIQVPVSGTAMRDQVDAMSEALGQVADIAAARLAR